MSSAFPSGYEPERKIRIEDDDGMEWDFMSDHSPRGRELSDTTWTTIPLTIGWLTLTECQTILDFIATNKATDVTMTIDGYDYIGKIISKKTRTMEGNWYSVDFTYYAKEA